MYLGRERGEGGKKKAGEIDMRWSVVDGCGCCLPSSFLSFNPFSLPPSRPPVLPEDSHPRPCESAGGGGGLGSSSTAGSLLGVEGVGGREGGREEVLLCVPMGGGEGRSGEDE